MKTPHYLRLVSAIASALLQGIASAAPGDLDMSFGSAGKAVTPVVYSDFGKCMAVQEDGKILVAGDTGASGNRDIAVIRYHPNGSLDTTFNGTGKVITDIEVGSSDRGNSVAVQPDGRILVAGSGFIVAEGGYKFAVLRYNMDGSLDTTFNGTGKVTTSLGSSGSGNSVAVQIDGKIVVGGTVRFGTPPNFTTDFAVVRYNSDGSLDADFGSGGRVTTPIGGDDVGNSVALQGDGKIILAGRSVGVPGFNVGGFAAVRYNSNGSLDTGFNGNGKVITDVNSDGGGNEEAFSVALQTNGRIVVAGTSYGTGDFALVRYNADGSLDTSFNTSGIVTTDFGGNYDDLRSISLLGNGKIVAAGISWISSGYHDIQLARYHSDGTLDTGFGSGGMVTLGLAATGEDVYGAALQRNGKIVVAGTFTTAAAPSSTDFFAARFDGELNVEGEQTVNLGASATFSVVAAGIGPLSYQWKKDGVPIPGATAASYMIPNTQPWHIGDYTVLVTDSGGVSASSPALLQIAGVPTAIWRGLLVYYPCDGNATDREPGGANATVSGAVLIADRLRQSGRAYDFDGIDDQLTATVPALPIGNAPRTISLWAKAGPDALRAAGLTEWGLPQNGEAIGIAQGSSPNTWAGKTGGAAPGVNSGVVVDSKWHHLCLTYADGTLSIYVDGLLKQSAAGGINTGMSTLTMGVGVEGSTYYPGSLDEVRIYNRALTASDVQQLKASEDPDTDRDGILDRFETGTGIFVSAEDTGTSATLADTDDDGLTDGAEVNMHHSNPNLTDTDSDGFPDGFEVNAGFDPASALSTPDVLTTLRAAREFRFNAATGVSYRIEGSTDTHNWTTLEMDITGTGGTVTRFYAEEELGPRYFLRAKKNQ